jgi:outer membrane protein assembly factor BamB
MKKQPVSLAVAAVLLLGALPASAAQNAPAKGNDKAPLGSPDFYPSPAHPVGWRGDGTGHFPGATPPTTWSRGANGERKNILWEAKLPCYSWATPIVVGNKVLTRSEPYDLICLDKNTGKILWIRSHPPFVAVSAAEKKANPAWKEIEPLVAELQKLNDAFAANGWSKELYKAKHDLQKQIDTLTAKADKKYKLPPDMYVESWSGYTGATPCSDGQSIFVSSGCGITAAYDLNGARKWERFENVTPVWGEHGVACSPWVWGDKLYVHTVGLHVLDKANGKELFDLEGPAPWGPFAITPLEIGGVAYVMVSGTIYRASDGKIAVRRPPDLASDRGVVHGTMAYYSAGRAAYYRLEPKRDGSLTSTPLIKEEYERINFPTGENPKYKIDTSVSDFYTASPLFHEGLLYCLSNWGRLVVVDTQKYTSKDAVIYTSFPPFDLKNPFSRKTPGFGICASPALAGKNIFMIDSAGCVLVLDPGREYKQVAKNNIDEIVPEGWEEKYWMGAHHEQTVAALTFDGSRIYIRGEQYLYCVGKK